MTVKATTTLLPLLHNRSGTLSTISSVLNGNIAANHLLISDFLGRKADVRWEIRVREALQVEPGSVKHSEMT